MYLTKDWITYIVKIYNDSLYYELLNVINSVKLETDELKKSSSVYYVESALQQT